MALEQLLMLGLNFLMCHSLPQVFVMLAILCGHALWWSKFPPSHHTGAMFDHHLTSLSCFLGVGGSFLASVLDENGIS
jgi:hypothetical protein